MPQPPNAALDRIRADRLQQLRDAEKPHAFDAQGDGLRCAHAGGNCGLPPMADVHDPKLRPNPEPAPAADPLEAARGAAQRDLNESRTPRQRKAAQDLLDSIDAKRPPSRREQDALKRQAAKQKPVLEPGDLTAKFRVVGQPAGDMLVEVTRTGPLIVQEIRIERTAGRASLVLHVPLDGVDVLLQQRGAELRLTPEPDAPRTVRVVRDPEGASTPNPEPDWKPVPADVVVPEASNEGAPREVPRTSGPEELHGDGTGQALPDGIDGSAEVHHADRQPCDDPKPCDGRCKVGAPEEPAPAPLSA